MPERKGINAFQCSFHIHTPHLYCFYAFLCLNSGAEFGSIQIWMLVPIKTPIGDKGCWQFSQKCPSLCFHGCVELLISPWWVTESIYRGKTGILYPKYSLMSACMEQPQELVAEQVNTTRSWSQLLLTDEVCREGKRELRSRKRVGTCGLGQQDLRSQHGEINHKCRWM